MAIDQTDPRYIPLLTTRNRIVTNEQFLVSGGRDRTHSLALPGSPALLTIKRSRECRSNVLNLRDGSSYLESAKKSLPADRDAATIHHYWPTKP
jgi:hypothetical protein